MARKKKKKGLPRKARALQLVSKPAIVQPSQPNAEEKKPDVLQEVAGAVDDLTSKVKSMFRQPEPERSAELPPVIQEEKPSVDSSTTFQTSFTEKTEPVPDTSQLRETVQAVHAKFGGSMPEPPKPERGGLFDHVEEHCKVEPIQAPEIIAPSHFLPPDTVRQLLDLGFCKDKGALKRLTGDESRALTPLTVDMIDEQGPRLFEGSQNRALWVWLTAMGVFIGVRSETGEKAIQWILDNIAGAVNRPKQQSANQGTPEKEKKASTQGAGDTTKPESQGSRAFLDFPVPEKPR